MIEDEWLSAICGRACFRVSALAAQAQNMEDLLLAGAAKGEAFYYSRLPLEQIDTATRMVRQGFRIVDTALTLEHPASHSISVLPIPDISVSVAQPEQAAAAADIAARSFRYSRFHLDPLFSQDIANRIKQAWIESYIRGTRGEVLYTSGYNGATEGFLATLLADNGETAVIDLIGVAPQSARRGIGLALVQHFIATWKNKTSCLRVGTQAANIPSLRLYEACGFRMASAAHVLHAHVQHGRIVS